MWSPKRILVPTDFSGASEAAMQAALSLAKKFDASIVVMHAYQLPIDAYPTSAMLTSTELVAQIEKSGRKELELLAARSRDSGVPITTTLRAGTPWEEVLRAAKEHDVGLIVIGSRGLRGLPRVLLGSTAERVVRFASVPVFTLHAPLPESGEDRADGTKAHGEIDRRLF
jgi:nucleotide-binding universal stress UspA family protein